MGIIMKNIYDGSRVDANRKAFFGPYLPIVGSIIHIKDEAREVNELWKVIYYEYPLKQEYGSYVREDIIMYVQEAK